MEEDVAWSHEIDEERDGDQFDRSERAALRRVAGFSTELEDVTEVEYRQLRLERVVPSASRPTGTTGTRRTRCRAGLVGDRGARGSTAWSQRHDKPDRRRTSAPARPLELRDIVLENGRRTPSSGRCG